MALKIPKEETASIAKLKRMSGASMEKLVAALKSAPPIPDPHGMAEWLAKEVSVLSNARLAELLAMLYTLYEIREFSGVPHSRFLEDLMEGIRQIPELKLAPKGLIKFQTIFEELMNIDSLSMVAKAKRLLRDGERLYCTAKILSDIRPVFGSDPAVRPIGAVLTHTLKLSYHEGSGHSHREFHIILDSSDLEALEEIINRAKIKDQTLRQLLKSAELTNLEE
jgi:hypothetical protein